MNEVEKLRKKRHDVVMDWDRKMEPLRKARARGEEVDWEKWDKLEKEMQIKTAKIDAKLFELGAV